MEIGKRAIGRIGKLQSAMEYLMTYGWSILLIAIVLAAVFELGVFNNNPISSSNTCIAQSGFLCSKPILNTTGSLNVTFGQAFGTTYTLTGVACVNSTASPPSTFTYINAVKFYSGETAPLNFKCPLSSNAIGSGFSGELWIQYNTATFSGEAAKVGLVDAKVSTGSAIGSGSVFVNYDVPITLTNLQSTSTGSNFQQMLSINSNQYSSYINGNWMNVEFTTGNALAGSPGTTLQAWVESGASNTATNTVVWVLLPNGIPAQSSTTIYMNFMAGNVMSASGPTGEAPQLSGNYAQYDNGANVFSYYNVAPTSNSLFSLFGTSGVTGSAPAGSYFGGTNALYVGGGSGGNYLYSSNPAFSPGVVITYWIYTPSGGCADLFFLANSAGGGQFARQDQRSTNTDNGQMYTTAWTTWSGVGNIANPTASNWNKFDIVIPSTGGATVYISSTTATPLGTLGSSNGGSIAINNNGNYFGMQGDSCGSGNSYLDGLIVRHYAPSGVMPSQGNGLSTPSQVIHYVPITLTNSQSAATPNNFQANVVFNAGAYQAYESSTLQNVEFFYANGTIIPSWMEGNTLNEQQTANVYTSNTILYWLNIAPQIAASGGSLTVYLGFAPTGTNLFNSVTTGEAPQLSTTYGQYDDGASVFNYYENFAGNTLPSGWTAEGSGYTYSVSNGITLDYADTGSTGYIYSPSQSFTANSIVDFYAYFTGTIGESSASGLGGDCYGAIGFVSGTTMTTWVWNSTIQFTSSSTMPYTSGVSSVYSVANNGLYIIGSENYGSTYPVLRSKSCDPSPAQSTAIRLTQQENSQRNIFVQWTRARAYAPNGVPPSVSFGTFV